MDACMVVPYKPAICNMHATHLKHGPLYLKILYARRNPQGGQLVEHVVLQLAVG